MVQHTAIQTQYHVQIILCNFYYTSNTKNTTNIRLKFINNFFSHFSANSDIVFFRWKSGKMK